MNKIKKITNIQLPKIDGVDIKYLLPEFNSRNVRLDYIIKTHSSWFLEAEILTQEMNERAEKIINNSNNIMFLGRSTEKMIFRIESRETHNDKKLAEVYEKFRSNDHQLKEGFVFKKEEIQSKFTDLSFNQKIQNIAGQQIADLVAYPIGISVLDKERENKSFEIVKTKFHSKNGEYLNVGLKIFP